MKPVYRFAPSPTGYLHIGNARTALWNFLLAQQSGGTFILRFDDTDTERSRPEYAQAILEDLGWLGIVPDRIEHQSLRLDRYALAFDALKASGHLYAAYETAEELERKRKRQQARGLPPVYDRAALALSAQERAELEAQGRKPHWRFKLSGQTVRWPDGIRGDSHIESAALSDPILVRADGSVLYTFASVVDDIEMGITDILRGEDHVANTAVQIEIFAALGGALPRFAHHNLIAAANGEEMSKRTGALSIRSFRAEGVDPLAVALVATLTGTSEAVRPLPGLEALGTLLALDKLSRALTKFDPTEIRALSTQLLHAKPFAAVSEALAAQGITGPKAQDFWALVHGNLTRLEEAALWWQLLTTPQAFPSEEPAFVAQAQALLPPGEITLDTWKIWTDALGAATSRKGKALFLPLRLALTGQSAGPELKTTLPFLGRETVLARLEAAAQGAA